MRRHPIPRYLLPHSARLIDVERDEWQHTVEKGSRLMKHIRIDADITRAPSVRDTVQGALLVLYFDCLNSLPAGITFRPGQLVEWNGARYIIRRVLPIWTEHVLHHYEVEMEGDGCAFTST